MTASRIGGESPSRSNTRSRRAPLAVAWAGLVAVAACTSPATGADDGGDSATEPTATSGSTGPDASSGPGDSGDAGAGETVATEAEDRSRYLSDASFRRHVLSRDLLEIENAYGNDILLHYSIPGDGWEVLGIQDMASAPLTVALAEQISQTGVITFDDGAASSLLSETQPETDERWVDLGRRTFHEYPAAVDSGLEHLARKGLLSNAGFIIDAGAYNGVRVVELDGVPRLAFTCSVCHSSKLADGTLNPILANRAFDLGKLRVASRLDDQGQVPPFAQDETTQMWLALGPGRSDPQPDGVFNPYAFADLGGIADMPYLHQSVNWRNTATVTLAVRVEITFLRDVDVGTNRIDRELSWAIATYLRSLPPPPPSEPGEGAQVDRGAEVFVEQGCDACHAPPLYTSDRLITVEEVGTDPAATVAASRSTGYVRIPSLRGVGRTAPYLHHGAVATLKEMFDAAREEPGHPFGISLSDNDQQALLRFLGSI
jgi:hypothetical protein